jgi:hypothetical protein
MRYFYAFGILLFLLAGGCDRQPSESVDNKRPPMGRSVSLDSPRLTLLIKEMEKRKIKYWKGTYYGNDYVAWGSDSDKAADEALKAISINPDLFTEMQKMRRSADNDKQDLTSR